MDRPELLKRYDAEERDFRTADLGGSKLSEVGLSGVNLSRANLSEGDLFGANLLDGISGAPVCGEPIWRVRTSAAPT